MRDIEADRKVLADTRYLKTSWMRSTLRDYMAEVERLREIPRENAARDVALCSLSFMRDLKIRDDRGNALTIEWGDPDEYGIRTPTITRHEDDNPIAALRAEVERLKQALEDEIEQHGFS